MKRLLSRKLNDLAEKLPIIFEEKQDFVEMTGADLMLTPYGDLHQLEKNEIYMVPIPKYVAVEHKQQIKDAFKSGGLERVDAYVSDIMSKFKSALD